jgi:uncharacterized protein (DUF1778 family)
VPNEIKRAKQALPPGQRRSERIPLMVTPGELKRIKQAAANAGKTVSTFCRDAVVQVMERGK